jgi:basic membrane lipoprotein Med (substrate-binding protein (PBP1-ABC) superfamily)
VRSLFGPIAIAAAICALAVGAVACGSDDGGEEAGSAGGEKTKVGWLIFGPKDDGGFGQIAYEAMRATEQEFGPRIENMWADNVPIGKQATTITERYAASGAKMLIDTGAVGDLFLDVCKKHPDKHCIEATYIGKPPANVSSYWSEWWKQMYLLGMASGKLTKSNVIGYVQPYNIPLVYTEQNAWLLGCQKVNPECKMRVVNINTWYDPPKTTQATNTLVDAGADVINSLVSDPSYCTAADKRGVWAVGLYKDWSTYCPDAYVNGALWDLRPYFKKEVELELAGKWTGGRMIFTPLGEGATLGEWGKNVPKEVSDLVDAEYDKMVESGENPIKGPIYDNKGKLRLEEGEEMSQDVLYTKWDWLVRGTIG